MHFYTALKFIIKNVLSFKLSYLACGIVIGVREIGSPLYKSMYRDSVEKKNRYHG